MATTSIDQVLDRLDTAIDRAIEDGDRSRYFAVMYRTVTAKVKEGVEAGFFDDAERMARLDAIFAERYFDAIAARDAGAGPTASWALAFDAAPRWRPLIVQHLLVGINAHINLDLGIAAARCSPGEELPGLRADFDRINAILAAVMGTIQDDLRRLSPWMGLLDRIRARTQTELVRFSIVTARAGAWRFAERLCALREEEQDAAIAARDVAVARVGQQALQPGAWLSSGLMLLRLRERGGVAANLRSLLDGSEPSLRTVADNVDTPTLTPARQP